jgi:endonuclease G
MRLLIVAIIAAAVGVAAYAYYKQQQLPPVASTQPAPALQSPHMLLGNPSGALADLSDRNNYLMVKPYYALSYADDKGMPNWVSWRVTEADLGTAPRKRGFDPDASLPAGFTRITQLDYGGSGFDRGHMCPHSDRAATEEMSFATFVMTNIVPQAPRVNQRAWAQLEMYCRDLVHNRHDRLYVIAGPAGRGGRGSAGFKERIGKDGVVVPAECWKVVVEVPSTGGEDDLAKITSSTRVIAVVMPNDNDAVNYEWSGFRTSPAEIERRTGYRFFDRLPADTAAALRQKLDGESVPPPRIPRDGLKNGDD